jgi:hypothetical protein
VGFEPAIEVIADTGFPDMGILRTLLHCARLLHEPPRHGIAGTIAIPARKPEKGIVSSSPFVAFAIVADVNGFELQRRVGALRWSADRTCW